MADDCYPCPCCGFLMFSEPPGSYVICALCGWEDDHVQLAYPAMRGGANGESLLESQLAALQKYPLEIKSFRGIERAPQWRPLRESDLETCREPTNGLSYFHAAGSVRPTYYWLRDVAG